MKLPPLSAAQIDRLVNKCLAALPKNLSPERHGMHERATRAAVEGVARRVSAGFAPNMRDVELEVLAAQGKNAVPAWLVRSRVVLVFRDVMRDPEFRRRFDALPRGARKQGIDIWADLAADLYRNYPDRNIMNRPATALRVLSGDDPELRGPISKAINVQPEKAEAKPGIFGRIMSFAKSALGFDAPASRPMPGPNRPARDPSLGSAGAAEPSRRPTASAVPPRPEAIVRPNAGGVSTGAALVPVGRPRPAGLAPAARPGLNARPGPNGPRPNGAPNGARPQQARPEQARHPEAESADGEPKARPQSRQTFEERIAARFMQRGLAPDPLRAATSAAKVMAEMVRESRTPGFFDVEYEVLMRSGESVTPAAVRTWTLHAFMESMRDPWFRELFHTLPLDDKTTTVAEWAKAAAEWFDVPPKLRDFWIRALSGGDPDLMAAAEPAFDKPMLTALPPARGGGSSGAPAAPRRLARPKKEAAEDAGEAEAGEATGTGRRTIRRRPAGAGNAARDTA